MEPYAAISALEQLVVRRRVGSESGNALILNGRALYILPDADLALGSSLLDQVNNPFFGGIASGPLSTPTITRKQSRLPYPEFTTVNGGLTHLGDLIYHAFALKIEKRFFSGFSVLASYTASKLIEDLQGTGRPGAVSGTSYFRIGIICAASDRRAIRTCRSGWSSAVYGSCRINRRTGC